MDLVHGERAGDRVQPHVGLALVVVPDHANAMGLAPEADPLRLHPLHRDLGACLDLSADVGADAGDRHERADLDLRSLLGVEGGDAEPEHHHGHDHAHDPCSASL